jgi:hypothetical protein
MPNPPRLALLPASARLVAGLFAVLIGIGYLVALGHMYLTYKDVDGRPGLSARDVQLKLYGKREKSKLESAIHGGPMEQYLRSPGDRQKVLAWVHRGAPKDAFHQVQPILSRSCASCHSSSGPAKFLLLTSFEEVAATTQTDRGESLQTLARVAHTHIQSLALVYLALGLLFCFTGVRERLKVVVVSTPFMALAADFAARGLARMAPEWAYAVLGSGMLLGLATGVMVCGILLDLLLPRKPALIWEPAAG